MDSSCVFDYMDTAHTPTEHINIHKHIFETLVLHRIHLLRIYKVHLPTVVDARCSHFSLALGRWREDLQSLLALHAGVHYRTLSV